VLKTATGPELLRAQQGLARTEKLLTQIAIILFDEAAAAQFDRLRSVKGLSDLKGLFRRQPSCPSRFAISVGLRVFVVRSPYSQLIFSASSNCRYAASAAAPVNSPALAASQSTGRISTIQPAS